MGSNEFMEKLQRSKPIREIFYKLLLLQCLKPGLDRYGAPYSNKEIVVEEIMELTKQWRRKKERGRFWALDALVGPFKEAVDSKDKDEMWRIFEEASNFQAKLRGKDSVKAGHYVKVMMGLLEAKKWDFALKEYERVLTLLSGESNVGPLSENQIQRFQHLLSVLEAFRDPEVETAWVKVMEKRPDNDQHGEDATIVRRQGETLLGTCLGNANQ